MPEGGGKGKHEKVTLTAAQKAAQNAEELRTPNSVSADMMSQAHETKHGGESEDENASPKELSGKEKLGQMIGAALSAAIGKCLDKVNEDGKADGELPPLAEVRRAANPSQFGFFSVLVAVNLFWARPTPVPTRRPDWPCHRTPRQWTAE